MTRDSLAEYLCSKLHLAELDEKTKLVNPAWEVQLSSEHCTAKFELNITALSGPFLALEVESFNRHGNLGIVIVHAYTILDLLQTLEDTSPVMYQRLKDMAEEGEQ